MNCPPPPFLAILPLYGTEETGRNVELGLHKR